MKRLLVVAIAVLPWMQGCDKPIAKPAAQAAAADLAADPGDGFVMEAVPVAADLGLPPHPKPQPQPQPKPIGPKPIGSKPQGHFQPYAGHPYSGGMHGPWAKHWLGYHYHGHYYLYGVYMPGWLGYTYRVWNDRWLYWSPQDYCWYRYDDVLGVYIPLNPDGTDAIDTAPPPPPPYK